jgi:uncharacterized protein involved in exopolysaccharide biosynthesis
MSQETERNDVLTTRAYRAESDLSDLRKKHTRLERDRNALLQTVRERDARIAELESRLSAYQQPGTGQEGAEAE